ncbi:hypothetical protein STEG23_005332, partial [Scotinomys teguina]
MCRLSWFLDPGGWSKTAAVGLYFIFPGICTLSLDNGNTHLPEVIRPWISRYLQQKERIYWYQSIQDEERESRKVVLTYPRPHSWYM